MSRPAIPRETLLNECKKLYKEHGIQALSFGFQKRIGIYHKLYHVGLSQAALLSELGLDDEYAAYFAGTPLVHGGVTQQRWSWGVVKEKAKKIVEREGFLPPAGWFQTNGYGSLVFAVYSSGHTWEDLRKSFNSFKGSSFVQSRNGMRWRSHPEASLSNFLYARGIKHKRGESYPAEYAKTSKRRFGMYDLHLYANDKRWIDIEVWGDKPNGQNEKKYKATRSAKEKFNTSNPNFLGIHFKDCLSDASLTSILKRYIGIIKPFQFDLPTDKEIETSHWSNADELLEACREIAAQTEDGIFPTEEWLRKRGKHKGRTGPTYNTVSIYIKTWLGGVRNLRKLLGQSDASTITWTREKAISSWQEFYKKYGMTPGQCRGYVKRQSVSQEVLDSATRIATAVNKYAGGSVAVNNLLGIPTRAKANPKVTSQIHGRKKSITSANNIGSWHYDLLSYLPETHLIT